LVWVAAALEQIFSWVLPSVEQAAREPLTLWGEVAITQKDCLLAHYLFKLNPRHLVWEGRVSEVRLLIIFEPCRREVALALNQLFASIFLTRAVFESVLRQPVVKLGLSKQYPFEILTTCLEVFAIKSR